MMTVGELRAFMARVPPECDDWPVLLYSDFFDTESDCGELCLVAEDPAAKSDDDFLQSAFTSEAIAALVADTLAGKLIDAALILYEEPLT